MSSSTFTDIINSETRIETDLIGSIGLPSNTYYGIHTWRAINNFPLSGRQLKHYPHFIRALAMVKLAAAKANRQINKLSADKAEAIFSACHSIINGQHHENFVVDMIQGGAGTSTNMNTNEVICNIALMNMNEEIGNYSCLHPNNDVNQSQSTNDVYPTAIRLSVLLRQDSIIHALTVLKSAFKEKAVEFSGILKIGRTQLQDAVPMTVSQEFNAWAHTLDKEITKITQAAATMTEVNIGGTAIGTGINADQRYGPIAIRELSYISGIRLTQASNLIEASSDTSDFVLFSSALKRLAIKLSKISNDLRLLSMGPRAGISEINLPAQQAGSSIMPGKVNPVIPEAMNQIAYQIIGNDLAISMASEAGQLQLNAMEPLIAYKLLESMNLLINGMTMLNEKCISGITVNKEHCEDLVNNSLGIVTALNPYIGYENASRIAKQALLSNCSIIEIARKENLLSKQEIEDILDPEKMT